MNDDTLRRLEFPHVIARLADLCSFAPSRELALRLKPSTSRQVVVRRLQELSEAVTFLGQGHRLPGRLPDISGSLRRASKGGTLRGPELAAIAEFAQVQASWGNVIRQAAGVPALRKLAGDLVRADPLVERLNQAITPEGEVRDQASLELQRLRRRDADLRQRIRERLDHLVRTYSRQGYLQESIITQRQGRFVLPVRAEYRTQVPGLIHDRSGSGLTLFVEPMEVTELNNDLRQVEAAIGREVERILGQLTSLVVKWLPQLQAALKAVAYLDFIFAKARLGEEMRAVTPCLVEEPLLVFKGARHPLLGERAVPVDIEVGREFDILIITGPNTGGKTVALKTTGLLVAMTLAGLQVPCQEAHCGIFAGLFADIGDEQSIEQNLSTFSSHLTNLLTMLPAASPNTLVLLDELGAGTDPEEGAALALAVIDYLRETGAKTIVTTHFGQLKTYAYRFPRVRNASVEFDPDTLQPTYRLTIGVPGRSNALDIAARLGLPASIVDKARDYLSKNTVRVEDALAELERVRRQLDQERAELQQMQAETRRLQSELQDALARVEEARRRFNQQERVLARVKLNEIIEEAERVLSELRQAAAKDMDLAGVDRIGTRTRRQLQSLRRELETAAFLQADVSPGVAERVHPPMPAGQEASVAETPLRAGDPVFVVNLNQVGSLLESPPAGGGEVLVQVGSLKIRVAVDQLRPITGTPTVTTVDPVAKLARHKAETVATEIYLRGLTTDEALWRLDKYLDDAFLAGLQEVKVIHGKGSGILRRAVHEALRADKRVKSFRLGRPDEGSYGVTIVRLAN